ncbi:MAG TPA: ribbon-helix-helix protein, CopG family [Vicinamibacteria bacterium]|nr:ribbon-helix-helix protein, CopG family [Vicinamibacteria bacterium]
MQTIQVVIEEELLRTTDRAARRLKTNRSALIRESLRRHLRHLSSLEREHRDREGYERTPETSDLAVWDKVLAWPEE